MPHVKKTNTVPRSIQKADFQAVGVEDQDAVEFNAGNDFTAEVSEAAAKHLTERDSFKVVKESSGTSSTSSTDSKEESTEDSESSTKTRSSKSRR